MTLRSYLAARLAYTVVLVLFIILLNWLIFVALPGATGGFADLVANPKKVNPNEYQRLKDLYGLNQPYWTRFYDYVKAMLTFQFGVSYNSQQDIATEMVQSGRLYNTLLLLGSSTIISIIIGILLGIVVSHKRGSSLDKFWVTSSLATFSFPSFWMGILLIMSFSVYFGWFPAGGLSPPEWIYPRYRPDLLTQILVRLQYLFLPALTLTLLTYGGFLLLTRATITDVLGEDYIVTARAKGLSKRIILMHHAFKNASLPLITQSALLIGGILGGAIITETVFNWPGLGRWLFESIETKDFPVMAALFYIVALCTILANFISDILYGIVDPRVKYE